MAPPTKAISFCSKHHGGEILFLWELGYPVISDFVAYILLRLGFARESAVFQISSGNQRVSDFRLRSKVTKERFRCASR